MTEQPRVLLVDHNRANLARLTEGLSDEGLTIFPFTSHLRAGKKLSDPSFAEQVNVALLDRDAFRDLVSLVRTLRRFHPIHRPSLPIIVRSSNLAGNGQVKGYEEIIALEAGAEACIPSTARPMVVAATIDSILRRSNIPPFPEEVVRYGDLVIDLPRHYVQKAGNFVDIGKIEWSILELLARNKGKILPDIYIVSNWLAEKSNRENLRTDISRLRQYLGENQQNPNLILTYPRIGYLLRDPERSLASYSDSEGRFRVSRGPQQQESTSSLNIELLVIGSDQDTLGILERELPSCWGVKMDIASSRQIALEALNKLTPDVIVVDLDEMDLTLSEIVDVRKDIPIIALSYKKDGESAAEALNNGAATYIRKPFNPDEVGAYSRAILRRTYATVEEVVKNTVRVGDLEVDLSRRLVRKNGELIVCTRNEWLLLEEFARHPGKVLTYGQLLTEMWGPDFRNNKQYLAGRVSRLRAKIEKDPKNPACIKTVSGAGYVFGG